jgi:hypothetical protein
LINIYTAHLFQAYSAAKDSGFAVCGENLASVSQFVAGIWHLAQARLQTRTRRHREQAEGLTLPQWPLSRPAQDEKPHLRGSYGTGRRHLALAARPKCALYGGREFLLSPTARVPPGPPRI